MQSQVVCRGCASVLLYPSGATNVCCALCSTVTSIPSPGTMNAGYFGNLGDGCFEELLIEKSFVEVVALDVVYHSLVDKIGLFLHGVVSSKSRHGFENRNAQSWCYPHGIKVSFQIPYSSSMNYTECQFYAFLKVKKLACFWTSNGEYTFVITNVSTRSNICEMLLLPCSEPRTRVTYLVCIITTDSLAPFFFVWYKGLGYNQLAHVNCGNCWTTLMYPNGSPSVKCPVCQYVTNVSMANMRVPLPANRPNGISGTPPSTSMTQTVVVENPMSVDESGKLVSNVVVGVTTEKKNTPVRF
ncbi:hypothetical protein DKX38_026118 [Salix brachista]|uniref:Zinc finger LSD1-type domain-containing protein n=1 Tax=Salix brachista TaxID=2182728 RepID=A0A5N5JRC1_9ROSI|nr:hypothetical protein DKX38_026118 [Salix brachista]